MTRARIGALLALCCAAAGCADAVLAAPAQPRPANFDAVLRGRSAPVGQPVRGATLVTLCRMGGSSSGPPALVVVDGRRLSHAELAALKPADIESVFIRKGADAVSEYGTAAAHGVVVVTTRAAAAR